MLSSLAPTPAAPKQFKSSTWSLWPSSAAVDDWHCTSSATHYCSALSSLAASWLRPIPVCAIVVATLPARHLAWWCRRDGFCLRVHGLRLRAFLSSRSLPVRSSAALATLTRGSTVNAVLRSDLRVNSSAGMHHYIVALFLFMKSMPPRPPCTTSGVLIVCIASASASSSGLSGLKLTVLILANSGGLWMSCC